MRALVCICLTLQIYKVLLMLLPTGTLVATRYCQESSGLHLPMDGWDFWYVLAIISWYITKVTAIWLCKYLSYFKLQRQPWLQRTGKILQWGSSHPCLQAKLNQTILTHNFTGPEEFFFFPFPLSNVLWHSQRIWHHLFLPLTTPYNISFLLYWCEIAGNRITGVANGYKMNMAFVSGRVVKGERDRHTYIFQICSTFAVFCATQTVTHIARATQSHRVMIFNSVFHKTKYDY